MSGLSIYQAQDSSHARPRTAFSRGIRGRIFSISPDKGMLTFPESSFSLLISVRLARGSLAAGTAARIRYERLAPTDGTLPTGEPPQTHTMIPPRHADPLAVYPAFHAGPDAVVVAAPAKLNLFLEILRKRPDGYHDLESLMLAVDLFDTLEVRPARRAPSPSRATRPAFRPAPTTSW